MGAFTVLATTTTGSAHASNSEVVTFLVSVNDEGGLPVTGLLNKNFLHATSVYPGGWPAKGTKLSKFTDTGSGTYTLAVVPRSGTWMAGGYSTSIVAGTSTSKGTTLTSFTITP